MQVPKLNGVEVEEDKPTRHSFWRVIYALRTAMAFPAKAQRRAAS